MLKTYRIIPLVFILCLFGLTFIIISPGFTESLHTSTHTPSVEVGPNLIGHGLSTGGGNGDYILYGRDETQDWCERLLGLNGHANLTLGLDIIHIQYHKQACYYYGAVTAGAPNAGVGGPHLWTYALSPLYYAIKSCNAKVDKRIQTQYGYKGRSLQYHPQTALARALKSTRDWLYKECMR